MFLTTRVAQTKEWMVMWMTGYWCFRISRTLSHYWFTVSIGPQAWGRRPWFTHALEVGLY